MSLIATSQNLIFIPSDKKDQRIGQLVQFKTPTGNHPQSFCLLGYPDDTGIQLNGGRVGAKDAPDLIRKFLFKMTPHVFQTSQPELYDAGNLQIEKSLNDTHENAFQHALSILKHSRLLSLGGGHDFGYADAAAFLEANTGSEKPLVLNFDAHLDVRPTDNGFHSGTPFRRLLEKYAGRFDFYEIGIQPQCNSREHLRWVTEQGATVIASTDCQQEGLLATLQSRLKPNPKRALWISLDMDSFSSTEAPGCSQSWTTGFLAKDFLPTLQWLCQNFSSKGLGLYEVSPALDFDHQTSKLAALILHHYLFGAQV